MTNFSNSNCSIIYFKKINPTKYTIEVNATSPFFLILSENYNKQWKAYISDRAVFEKYDQLNITEAKPEFRFDMRDISYLLYPPSFDNSHFLANGYANGWHINKTGNYSITLYFLPQSYFYLGLLISLISLIAFVSCVCIFIITGNMFMKHY
jgi:hypothetical protein